MSLLLFLALSFAAATSGAIFPPGRWYDELRKPRLRPPPIAFPIVWTVLYLLIAIAAWRVSGKAEGTAWTLAMAAYGIQLVLNAAWSAIFFGLKRMRTAFVDLVLLWISVAAMIVTFAPVDAAAAWMLAPYLAWVTAAGALNFAMMRLNPATRSDPRTNAPRQRSCRSLPYTSGSR